MRKRWLLILAGLVLFVVALIAQAPAALVPWLIHKAGGQAAQQLQLSQVQGTLWQGQTHVQAQLPTGGQLQLHQLQWRLSPWRLVIGQVALEVDIPALAGNELHGQLALQLGQQQVALQTHLQGAIQPLITQLKLPVPITLAGHLELHIDDYALGAFDGSQWCERLRGTAITRGTEMRINHEWHALGDFQTELSCTTDGNSNAVAFAITQGNALGLTAQAQVSGHWGAPQLAVTGSIVPNTSTPAPIRELLVFLGQPDAQGRYRFSW